MKKTLLLIILTVTSLSNALAQRVDIDKFAFDYKYRQVPNLVLDTTLSNYSVNITKTKALQAYSNETEGSAIKIEGRNFVESNGRIIINISFEDLMIESSAVEQIIEVKKDKDGKETGRTYTYKVNVVYTFASSANISDYKGAPLKSYNLKDRFTKQTYSSQIFNQREEASEYYSNNKLEIKTKLSDEQINTSLSTLNWNLSFDFAYLSMHNRVYIWTTDSKKHPENTLVQQAAEATKIALMQITSKEIPASVLTELDPIIKYYLSIPTKYTNPSEKQEKKIRFAAYYNLANIYFLTDQFEKAKEYAALIISNDYDPKDGENLIEDATNIVVRYKKHGLNSRHFYVNIEKPNI